MRILSICISICLFFSAHAQIHTSETWTDIEVSTDIFENSSIEYVIDLRVFNDVFDVKSFSNEIGYTYRFNREFRMGISHKITYRNYTQGFFPNHKTSVQFQYRTRVNHVRLSYRNKLEFSRNTYTKDISDLFVEYENRNRIKATYRRRKLSWEPSLTIETFHPIHNKNVYAVSEMRAGAGVSFDIFEDYSIEFGYTYRTFLQKRIPESTSIFSISFSKGF